MYLTNVKIKAIVHEADEGGLGAEVPSIPGYTTRGDTMDEMLVDLRGAVEECLSVEISPASLDEHSQVLEIAV